MNCDIPPTANRDARVEVLGALDDLRRSAGNAQRVHEISDKLEVMTRTYLGPQCDDVLPGVRITGSQNRLLMRLMKTPNQAVAREALMDAIYWDRTNEPNIGIVDVFVCKLRKKLKGSKWDIRSVWGVGYKLVELADDAAGE